MGGSTSVENNSELITEITTSTLLRTINKCTNDVSALQLINMECTAGPEEVIAARNSHACTIAAKELAKQGITTPPAACYACVMSDIDQSMLVQYDAKCNGETINYTDVRKEIKNALDAHAKMLMKGMSMPLESTEAKNITKIVTKLSNSIENETINEALSKLSAAQVLTQKGSGGLQSVITQDMAATMTSDVIFGNKNTALARDELSNELTLLADLKKTGPFAALFEELGKTIRGVVDSITDVVGLPLRTLMMIIGLVIVLIVIGVLIWMMRKGSSGPSSGASSGTKVSSTGKGSSGSGENRLGFLGNLLSKKRNKIL